MSIVVDINTAIIDDRHRVMIARPGAKYRLFDTFIERNFVGIELPGFFLQEEEVNLDDVHITARIKRSFAIRRWFQREQDEPFPSLDLRAYEAGGETDRIRQFRRIWNFYAKEAKVGDLIVVPPAAFGGDAFIGQIRQDFRLNNYLVPQYLGYPILGIPLHWIGNIRKRDLPTNSIEALRKPAALFAVGPDHRNKIYTQSYGNFFYKDRYNATFITKSETYSSSNELTLQAFFNSVAFNTKLQAEGERRALSLGQAAARILDEGQLSLGEFNLELALNINSPGTISVISEKITPLVAAVLFSLAVSVGPGAMAAAEAQMIEIRNSAAGPGDECAARVYEQVRNQMLILGYDKWIPECERLVELQNDTEITPQSTAEEHGNGG